VTRLERGGERCGGRDLGREHLAGWGERADGGSDTAREPSASVRRDDGVGVAQVLEDLERDCPVARHHGVVAEGVDVEPVEPFEGPRPKDLVPLVERDLDHLAAQAPDRLDLGLRSRVRKDDRAADAELAGPPGDALRHVSRARRPNAALELLWRGEEERVPRAAQLERADRLEALELEVDLSGCVFELEAHERGAEDRAGEALTSGLDLGERDHSSTSVPRPSSSARRYTSPAAAASSTACPVDL
jgi:hypothetical protein